MEKAAKWLEAKISLGGEVMGWDDLAENLLDRFKKEQTDVTAALAMGELQQGGIERVADFYDRCVLALKKKNHRVNDQLKGNADFKQAVEADFFVFFDGGLKRYIRNATLSSAKPSESVMELLRACLLYTSPSPRDRG